MKEMCALQDSDRIGTHREADQRGWREMKVMFGSCRLSSELMTDPFSLDKDDDDNSPLLNIATGIRIPPDAAARLLNSSEIGTAQMTFVEQRLNTNEVKFWDSLPNLKIRTSATKFSKQ